MELRGNTNSFSWRHLLALWAALAVVQTAMLWNNAWLDTQAWRATRWVFGDQANYSFEKYSASATTRGSLADISFYEREKPPLAGKLWKRTESIWPVLKTAGEPVFVVIVAVGLLIFDQRRKWYSAAALIAGTASAGVLSWLVRAVTGRYRPINIDGVNVWEWMRGFDLKRNSDLSWPSGHATAAFALAAVMAYFFPRGKWYFVAIAAACAWSRVVNQAHFYSDAIWGGVLGWTVGGVVAGWAYGRLAARDRTMQS